MTGQFDKQINTHHAKDWSNYRVFCSHATTEVRSGDCTRVYTPKTCHSFHGKLTLSEPGTFLLPVLPTTMGQEPFTHRFPFIQSNNPPRTFSSLKSSYVIIFFQVLIHLFSESCNTSLFNTLILQYFSLFNTSIASARLLCCLLSGSSTILITICKQSLIL